jgi:pentatricopeptide repeat protein
VQKEAEKEMEQWHHDADALPQAVQNLNDANLPVQLPEPSDDFKVLSAAKLHGLVILLSTNKRLRPRMITLLDWLLAVHHPLGEHLCTTFISALARHGQHRRALLLYDSMDPGLGVPRSPYTHTAALIAATSAGLLGKSDEARMPGTYDIWRAATRTDMTPEQKHVLTSTYMSALQKQRRFNQVVQLFRELRKRYDFVDERAWALAMRAEAKLCHPEAALHIWDSMQEAFTAPSRALPPTVHGATAV